LRHALDEGVQKCYEPSESVALLEANGLMVYSRKHPKVVLLFDTSRGPTREILRGIARYAQLHGPWRFQREERFYVDLAAYRRLSTDRTSSVRRALRKANGLIGYVLDTQLAEQLMGESVPMVTLEAGLNPKLVAIVTSDDRAIAQMAAEYFLNGGFQHLAYCGIGNLGWSIRRGEFFAEALASRQLEVHSYVAPKSRMKSRDEDCRNQLAAWVEGLPKPVGVLACNDDRAQDVLDACEAAKLRVPAEVAVLGVDNDELVCNLCAPPLWSIALNFQWAGYEAAALLDKMMSGQGSATEEIVYGPTNIAVRMSTDILAMEDRELAQAISFIRQHVNRALTVEQVVETVAVSRRNLERRFQKVLGRSIYAEIRRVRVDEIARLLVETNLPISKIAYTLGFAGVHNLSRVFRKEKGMSPLAYRESNA
jgi:LacI family transcriptional regulator